MNGLFSQMNSHTKLTENQYSNNGNRIIESKYFWRNGFLFRFFFLLYGASISDFDDRTIKLKGEYIVKEWKKNAKMEKMEKKWKKMEKNRKKWRRNDEKFNEKITNF